MKAYSFLFYTLLLLASCREDVNVSALEVYDGPINSATDIHLVQSDSAIIRSEIRAPKQLEYANGNLEFPEGIDITFFEKDGTIGTTMRADRGYYLKSDNIYKGVGDVKVNNLLEDQKLQAEELFWNPTEKRIYTETFVTVQDGQTLFNGTGMESDETFTNYQLKNITDSRTVLPGEGQ
ncbi:LPS export ABC transporter periplasmic protein LptC [Algoriphagus namhaensis]|uniref:LPS export ABC transporter periplasmic protein LptC n=1 Tax=Algoriphagus namhaensis TaxID=915353 RepID=A0ABV8AQ22_9BACT